MMSDDAGRTSVSKTRKKAADPPSRHLVGTSTYMMLIKTPRSSTSDLHDAPSPAARGMES